MKLQWRDGDVGEYHADIVSSENEIWVYGDHWITIYELGNLQTNGACAVGDFLRQQRIEDDTHIVRPCSCSCGGRWAYLRIRSSGAEEMVGCICHTDIPYMSVVDISGRIKFLSKKKEKTTA